MPGGLYDMPDITSKIGKRSGGLGIEDRLSQLLEGRSRSRRSNIRSSRIRIHIWISVRLETVTSTESYRGPMIFLSSLAC